MPRPRQPAPVAPARLQSRLLAWFDVARRDLPWRRTRDPYAVWLSEIMLQQTRVETVIPYYERFLAELPDVKALAEAPAERVMSLWSGLGYYRRARMLHDAAKEIAVARFGVFPSTAATLGEVRGIGRYTAGAIASIAFDEPAPLVDGNVARVLARLFALEDDVKRAAGAKRVWQLAADLVPQRRAGDWNQSLMELGALVCTPRGPRCHVCPVRDACRARALGMQEELPRLSERRKPPVERKVSLVLRVKGKILLFRRRPDGLFGGMWEPPLLDASPEGSAAEVPFEVLLAARLARVDRCGEVVHVLSHRRLEITVLAAKVPRVRLPSFDGDVTYDAAMLATPASFGAMGMSTLARKLLARADVVPGA